MSRIYGCITEYHDLRLVILAALICLLGCYTALSLLGRARMQSGAVSWPTSRSTRTGRFWLSTR